MLKKVLSLFISIALTFSSFTNIAWAQEVNVQKPILVVIGSSAANPFGNYMGEILKAEGFNEFEVVQMSSVTLEYLKGFSMVILTETQVNESQKLIFENYVNEGGNLIGIRPDTSSLATVFGISDTANDVAEGYIKIDTSTDIGTGLEAATMKFHGTADGYNTTTGTKIANLYSNSSTDSGYAAVVKNTYGAGHTVAFSYDLCKSIVYTRQGNPEYAGEERDGHQGVRAIDMMYDNGGSYNDKSKSGIPQADEQMRLLSRSIEWLSSFKNPMPRLWYLPDGKKAVAVVTGDQDSGDFESIDDEFATVKSYGGNASIYMTDISTIDAEAVTKWINDGHEPGIHFDNTANFSNPTWDSMNQVYTNQFADFQAKYGSDSLPVSVRNHWILWCGTKADGTKEFAAQAEIEQNHGLKMDFNYYSVYSEYQGDVGYENGSGLALKFAKSNGEILDIYQSDTQLPDEAWHGEIYNKYRLMVDRALNEGKYAWLNLNFHPYLWNTFKPFAQQILQYSKDNSIPIWSGKNMYDFINMKDNSNFSDITWDNTNLSFKLNTQGTGYGNLTVMVPVMHNGKLLSSVTRDNSQVSYTVEKIKGTSYAFITTAPGNYSFTAAYSGTLPQQVVLNPIGNKTVTEGNPLEFTINATHDPALQVNYTATGLPNGAAFNQQTGLFSWTPTLGQAGAYVVQFKASDGFSEDSESVTITVNSEVFLPENGETIWGDKTAQALTNDPTSYELGTIFSASTEGKITHIRVFGVLGESGDHTARIWRNSDNTVIGGPYTINYSGMNGWIYYDIPDIDIDANVAYTVSVTNGTDAGRYYPFLAFDVATAGNNGKNLSYPANAGVFTTSIGSRPTQHFNSNNYFRDIVFVPVEIANTPPVLEEIGNKSVLAGNTLSFTVNANDAENDTLSFSVENLPLGATFNPGTRAFSWAPGEEQAGIYTVTFKVDDGKAEDSETVTIVVSSNSMSFPNNAETIWGSKTGTSVFGDNTSLELGTKFKALVQGRITHIRVFGALGETGNHIARIWRNSDGAIVGGPYTFNFTGSNNWVYLDIEDLILDPDVEYTVSVSTGEDERKNYIAINDDIPTQGTNGRNLYYPADAGVFAEALGTIPTTSFKSSNYLRDVVFAADTNRAPVLDAIGDKTVAEGSELKFTVSAVDPESDNLTYTAEGLPTGATFDASNRTFSWTPGFNQAGSYNVKFTVSDGELIDSEEIEITVTDTNRAPILDVIGDKTVAEGSELKFVISASNPDSNNLTYTAEGLPAGATFDASNRTFSWTPGFNQAGSYNVKFTVSDGELIDSEEIDITVTNTNRAPVLNAIGNKTVAEGSELKFVISASDPDGNTITYYAENLPEGAVFNSTTRTFTWTPNYKQSGEYRVKFIASDGFLRDEEEVIITVNNTTAATLVENLINKVKALKLQKGIETSLISKLYDAWELLNNNTGETPTDIANAQTAIGYINDFINQVKAQGGKKIKNADELIKDAQTIIEVIKHDYPVE